MTPAAFTMADADLRLLAAARRDDAIGAVRSPRRILPAFIAGDIPSPLFHAWRP